MTDLRVPETFRGITVPPEVANRANYGMWKLAVTGVLDTVVPLLERFEDGNPCSLDHHGFCQEHWSGGDDECRNAALKKFLDGARYGECVWRVPGTEGAYLYWCYQHRPMGIQTDRADLVRIDTLPEYHAVRRCVQCGRELSQR